LDSCSRTCPPVRGSIITPTAVIPSSSFLLFSRVRELRERECIELKDLYKAALFYALCPFVLAERAGS